MKYSAQVKKLLSYGDCSIYYKWPDYMNLGFTHKHVPELIRMATDHTFMILTKRPQRMHDFRYLYPYALPNMWLGVSVEDQQTWDHRVPKLLEIQDTHYFVSIEPMLGPVDMMLDLHTKDSPYVEWIICGGESGPHRRPMHPDWVRSLRDQCKESDVPFFFKQVEVDGKVVHMPRLDGRTWEDFPA